MFNTPHYVFDTKKIKDSYIHMKNCLSECDLYYAMKANSEIGVLKILNESGAKFEVASEGELRKLKTLKIDPTRIICSLPVKTRSLIKELNNYGCDYFVFDCLEEFHKIDEISPNSRKVLRVYINDILDGNIQFGMNIDEINQIIDSNSYICNKIEGITFYLRKNYDISALQKVFVRCEEILEKLNSKGNIKFFNIGGNYRPLEQAGREYYEYLNSTLKRLSSKFNLKILAEVGRSIIKQAGKLHTEVQLVKNTNNEMIVFIDAGLPTGISYAPRSIKILNRNVEIVEHLVRYQFVGTTCSHAVLFRLQLPFFIMTGDQIAFDNFGSYSICKSSNFHGWDKPSCNYI